jgi:hypothetical protein
MEDVARASGRELVYVCVRLRARSRGFVPIIPAVAEEVRHDMAERLQRPRVSQTPQLSLNVLTSICQ